MERWFKIEERLTVVPIGGVRPFSRYLQDLHSDARARGLPIQHDHTMICGSLRRARFGSPLFQPGCQGLSTFSWPLRPWWVLRHAPQRNPSLTPAPPRTPSTTAAPDNFLPAPGYGAHRRGGSALRLGKWAAFALASAGPAAAQSRRRGGGAGKLLVDQEHRQHQHGQARHAHMRMLNDGTPPNRRTAPAGRKNREIQPTMAKRKAKFPTAQRMMEKSPSRYEAVGLEAVKTGKASRSFGRGSG